MSPTHSRRDVLALLRGERIGRRPCFSGLISVTTPGLTQLGLRFGEVHADPGKMAAAAASTYKLFGFESAVVPLDLMVEAETLGCQVDFHPEAERIQHPTVTSRLAQHPRDLDLRMPGDPSGWASGQSLGQRGRLPVVTEALRRLRDDVGDKVAIGAWVPGPFTLAWQVLEVRAVLAATAADPDAMSHALNQLTEVIIAVANLYRQVGADFITVHEMGGSPGVIGPKAFERFVRPQLVRIFQNVPSPHVLSICGNTNRAIELIAACGADALSVDHMNDLARTRQVLGAEVILLGNYDPIGVLANGTREDVRRAVEQIIRGGADAVWPGCDLWPEVPERNMRALMAAVGELGR